jgi:hypothetical protein
MQNDNVVNYLLRRRENLLIEVNHYKGTKAVATYNMLKEELDEVESLLLELKVIPSDMLIAE